MDSLFWFRKGEFRGIIFIVLLAVLWIGIEACYMHFSQPDPLSPQNRERLLSLLNRPSPEFAFAMTEQKDSISKAKKNYPKKSWKDEEVAKKQTYISLGTFNPCTLEDQGWLNRGLSPKQLKTLRNFQSKGGRFYRPSDFDKIYGWNKSWLNLAKADMLFPQKHQEEINIPSNALVDLNPLEEAKPLIDINLADSLMLVEIQGIGPFYAHQILLYRAQLGGFVHPDQLKEVYKMRDENWSKLIEQTTFNSTNVRCLAVNTLGFEELAQHPYVSWVQAKGLVSFRELHGGFQEEVDIEKTHLFNAEELLKLKPYLCFDDRNRN